MNLPNTPAARQAVKAIAFENAVDSRIGYSDPVITFQIPDNPHGSVMVCSAKMQDFFSNLGRGFLRVVVRH